MLVTVVGVLGLAGSHQPARAQDPGFTFVETPTPDGFFANSGPFGGSAELGGTQLLWSGVLIEGDRSPLGATWTRTGGTWTPHCGTEFAGATDPCAPGVRVYPGVASASNGIILYGGLNDELGQASTGYGDTWLFNGTNWTELCNAASCGPGVRFGPALGGNGDVAVMFGTIVGPSTPIPADTWVYDPDVDPNSWTQVCGGGGGQPACGPDGLSGAAIGWDGTQFVLFGGGDISGSSPSASADTWVFDGVDTWTQVCGEGMDPCGPDPRELHSMATLASENGIVMAGGGIFFEGFGLIYRDVWFWDSATMTWTEVPVPWDSSPVDVSADPDPAGCGLYFPQVIGGDAAVAVFGDYFGHNSPDEQPTATFDAGFDIPGTPAVGVCTGGAENPPDSGPTTTAPPPTEVPTSAAPAPTLPATGAGGGGGLPGVPLLVGIGMLLAGALVLATARGAAARRGTLEGR